jgi:hypothetical protein
MILCGLCQKILFLSVPQVFPKFLLNSRSCQNRRIRFYKLDWPILDTGYVQPLHRIPVSFLDLSDNLPGHVQPLSKNLKLDQNLHFGLPPLSTLIYVIM